MSVKLNFIIKHYLNPVVYSARLKSSILYKLASLIMDVIDK